MRYLSIILEPGRFVPDYGVVDLEKRALIARCTSGEQADLIEKVLNMRAEERQAVAQLTNQPTERET